METEAAQVEISWHAHIHHFADEPQSNFHKLFPSKNQAL